MSEPDIIVVTPAVLRDWSLSEPGDGKEERGHVLVVAGTTTTPGAARLAAEAALRVGAGKLTIATTAPTASALAVAVPEAQVVPLAHARGNIAAAEADTVIALSRDADVVLVGPGFTEPEPTHELLVHLVPRLDVPVVLDATASVYIGQRPEAMRHLAAGGLLTVNPHELALTAHRSPDVVNEDPGSIAASLAESTGIVVLCGGTEKHIASPDGRRWVFQGGSPGLGISGSGDVQAGLAAGLVARGAELAQAAVWAAYLHGRVGERLAAAVGQVGAMAREQLAHVPLVLAELA